MGFISNSYRPNYDCYHIIFFFKAREALASVSRHMVDYFSVHSLAPNPPMMHRTDPTLGGWVGDDVIDGTLDPEVTSSSMRVTSGGTLKLLTSLPGGTLIWMIPLQNSWSRRAISTPACHIWYISIIYLDDIYEKLFPKYIRMPDIVRFDRLNSSGGLFYTFVWVCAEVALWWDWSVSLIRLIDYTLAFVIMVNTVVFTLLYGPFLKWQWGCHTSICFK